MAERSATFSYRGQLFKEARLKKGLTERQLARKLNGDYTLIYRIENGIYLPTEPYLTKICEMLDIDKNHVLFLSGEYPANIRNLMKTLYSKYGFNGMIDELTKLTY